MSSSQEMETIEKLSKQLDVYRELNQRLTAVIQTSPEGIWVCDGKGKVLIINETAYQFLGCNAMDILGKNIIEFVKEGLFDESATLKVLETRKPVSVMQYVRKTKKYLLVSGIPIFDSDDGSISLVVTHGRDMTQLNAIKEALEESRLVTEKFRDELSELTILELNKNEIIAKSKKIKHVLRFALKLAKVEGATILILGESGTGKGLLAKFIHQNSKRKNKPFIQINCAAFPENLLEAELFGYEKGAFTGASDKGKAGLFELAHGGTLFLDEIGDLPLTVQAKLLKYLDDREVLRLGSLKPRKIDCVVITATNQDLDALKMANKFRDDLFFRLNSFTFKIPPLRERYEDILEMLSYFQRKYEAKYRIKRKLSKETLRQLQSYSFPGNVRELKNLVKKALVLGDEALFEKDTEKPIFHKIRSEVKSNEIHEPAFRSIAAEIAETERDILSRAMAACRTTREIAAVLKVNQSTVVRKMKKLGLSKKR
jgi:PAS domain S-box-containing protein